MARPRKDVFETEDEYEAQDTNVEVKDKMSHEELTSLVENGELSDAREPAPLEDALKVYASMVKDGAFDDRDITVEAIPDMSVNDPFDDQHFVTCGNTSCDIKAACLRWRLRSQGKRNGLHTVLYRDEGSVSCFIDLNRPIYREKLILDPIEDNIGYD